MLQILRVVFFVVAVIVALQPTVVCAQDYSVQAFYEAPGGAPGPVAARVSPGRVNHPVANRASLPSNLNGLHRTLRTGTLPTSHVMAKSALHRFVKMVFEGVRTLTSGFTRATAVQSESDTFPVGCQIYAGMYWSYIDFTGTIKARDWVTSQVHEIGVNAWGYEFINTVSMFNIPRSTDTYTLECTGEFTFSEVPTTYSAESLGEVPQTLFTPTGEHNQSAGWNGAEDTVHQWRVTLQPEFVNFFGRYVKEAPGPTPVDDQCHFPGSAIPYAPEITELTVQLPQGQNWFIDLVGMLPNVAGHYRTHHRYPCEMISSQQMSISSRGGMENPKVNYLVNTVVGGLTSITAYSRRATAEAERIWP